MSSSTRTVSTARASDALVSLVPVVASHAANIVALLTFPIATNLSAHTLIWPAAALLFSKRTELSWSTKVSWLPETLNTTRTASTARASDALASLAPAVANLAASIAVSGASPLVNSYGDGVFLF